MLYFGPDENHSSNFDSVSGHDPCATQPSASPAPRPGFHHLHLNSVNPDAAIDFYMREFPSTMKSTFAAVPPSKRATYMCCSQR